MGPGVIATVNACLFDLLSYETLILLHEQLSASKAN
jgi:hypothetical protein